VRPEVIKTVAGPVYPIQELVTSIPVRTPPDTVTDATAPPPPPPDILICV
jgi:hypothetical protein